MRIKLGEKWDEPRTSIEKPPASSLYRPKYWNAKKSNKQKTRIHYGYEFR